MKGSHINICIDILMFVVMMPVIGIGFLMKYVLVNGTVRNACYGSDCDLLYWGLDRHQWGSIHLLLSLILVALLVLHLVLHWHMMIALFKNMVKSTMGRVATAVILPLTVVFFAIVPLFLKPQVVEKHREHYHRESTVQEEFIRQEAPFSPVEETVEKPEHKNNTLENEPENSVSVHHEVEHEEHLSDINGKMTLQQIADNYQLSVADLAAVIEVSVHDKDQTLGRLKKRYGFDIDVLRDFVDKELSKE